MNKPVEITLEWACPACGSYEIEVCTYTWPNKPKQKPPVWATCHECGANGPAEEFLRPATEEEEGPDEQAQDH